MNDNNEKYPPMPIALSKTISGRALALTSASFLALSSSALAKDTVVDDYFSMIEDTGQSVTIGQRNENGDDVEWRDIVIADKNGDGSVSLDWMKLETQSDGGARLTLSPVITISANDLPEGGSAKFEMTHTGLEYLFRESGGSVDQAFNAETVKLAQVEGDLFSEFDMTMIGLSGQHIYPSDNLKIGTGNMLLEKLDMTYAMNTAEVGNMGASATLDEMTIVYDYDMSDVDFEADEPDLAAFNMNMSMRTGASSSKTDMSDFGSGAFDATAGPTELDVSISDGRLAYDGSGVDLKYDVEFSAMGMPRTNVSADEFSFGIESPIAKSDDFSDMRFQLNFLNLIIGEELWGMFDPSAILPRDPSNVQIDVTGQARVNVDLRDGPQSNAALPYEVSEVNINTLSINAAGASIDGNGAVNLSYQGPVPMPTGKLEFNINGVNGLLDKLGQIGLLQPEQAMPARMMLGMFANPVGEDMLQSIIEFKDDGSILANGQRIR
jgi:hypothetical protein